MPTLTIGDRKVKVDDSFLSLSPEQQNATVDEISSSFAAPAAAASPAPDNRPLLAKADDYVRLAADTASFGLADRLAGYMEGTGTEAERTKTAAARERTGWGGTAAEVAGAISTPWGLAKAGVTAARLLPSGAGLTARTGVMAAEGAAYGTASAVGHGTDIATGAGVGALAGAGGSLVGEGLSAGVRKVAGAFSKSPVVPTTADIKVASQAAYREADNAGLIVAPQGMQRLKADIQNDLAQSAYHPKIHPNLAAVVSEVESLSTKNVSLKGVDVLRQIAGAARESDKAAERRLAGQVIDRIDDFIANIKPNEVLVGDAAKGAAAIKDARNLWSRQAKAETVAQAVIKAERRAASTFSGGNVDNTIRQNLRSALERGKLKGLTGDEREAVELAIRGSKGQNLSRLIGKLSPSGNGLMMALGTGATVFNPIMGIAPAVGFVAKKIADRATPANVEQLSRVIRSGGSASATRAAPNAVQRLTDSKREALVRALMASGIALAR